MSSLSGLALSVERMYYAGRHAVDRRCRFDDDRATNRFMPEMRRTLSLLFTCCLIPLAQAQDFALAQLEQSPRHHEWVEIPVGDRTLHGFVAYPETSDPAPSVIVIHENRGLTDWVRSFADQLAAEGYIAVAPDLLSEFDAGHAKTSDFESSDAAREAIYRLDPEQVTADLFAAARYATGLESSNGKLAVIGFCWGGAQAFRFATVEDGLNAALVFYGSPPETGFSDIEAPVFGFYGENDERINATIPATRELMEQHDKAYDVVIYEGAGHAFMRAGDDPEGTPESKTARDRAWERIRNILSDL